MEQHDCRPFAFVDRVESHAIERQLHPRCFVRARASHLCARRAPQSLVVAKIL
jgi:hypothetical protein